MTNDSVQRTYTNPEIQAMCGDLPGGVKVESLGRADELLSAFKRWLEARAETAPADEVSAISGALEVVFRLHRHDARKTGETYVIHPLDLALFFIQELGIEDHELIVAALLHDSHEDHPRQLPVSAVEQQFGPRVARIVRGVTNEELDSAELEGLDDGARQWVEIRHYQRHVAEAIEDDDVFVVKVLDFANNALCLANLDHRPELQARLANKYLALIAVFARRAGECVHTRQHPKLATRFEDGVAQVEQYARQWKYHGRR